MFWGFHVSNFVILIISKIFPEDRLVHIRQCFEYARLEESGSLSEN